MITEKMIKDNIGDVQRITDGILKFRIIIPAFQFTYYLGYTQSKKRDVLLVSRDYENDVFAMELIRAVSHLENTSGLSKRRLEMDNQYGFDTVLLAGPEYHQHLKGRLDDARENLYLFLPIFTCEFSGEESSALFGAMCFNLIEADNWKRHVTPRILWRFDNPKTKAGTRGKKYFPIDFDYFKFEIKNLNGVAGGFIEVLNYRDESLRITSASEGEYAVETQGKVIYTGGYPAIEDTMWKFLTNSI